MCDRLGRHMPRREAQNQHPQRALTKPRYRRVGFRAGSLNCNTIRDRVDRGPPLPLPLPQNAVVAVCFGAPSDMLGATMICVRINLAEAMPFSLRSLPPKREGLRSRAASDWFNGAEALNNTGCCALGLTSYFRPAQCTSRRSPDHTRPSPVNRTQQARN